MTASESELLAVTRFRNFDEGTRAVTFEVKENGTDLRFEGWYDFVGHVGYGTLDADGARQALLSWSGAEVAAHEPGSDGAESPAPLPVPDTAADAMGDEATGAARGWVFAPLDPAGSRLHSLLQIVTSLGSDRPDNPLLLSQGGALVLGTETVDGKPTTLFSGPLSDSPLPEGQQVDPETATTRFWVGAEGKLIRAGIRLGGDQTWQTVDLGPAPNVVIDSPFDSTHEQ